MNKARALFSGVLGVVAVSLVLFAVAAQFGVLHFRVVESSSMEPDLSVGDLLINQDQPAAEAQIGEIATIVHPEGHLVTHRVLSNEPSSTSENARDIEMQGDDNPIADASVYTVTETESTVVTIPWVGHAVLAVGGLPGIWLIIGITGGLMLIAGTVWPARSPPAKSKRVSS